MPDWRFDPGQNKPTNEKSASKYWGLNASLAHPENGMPECDMRAILAVADQLDEVIMFRATGPWALSWIKKGYPTKNFHIKGKTSDWGPQAGLVPYEGRFSKNGHLPGQAACGTADNQAAIDANYAGKKPLTLSYEDLQRQVTTLVGLHAKKAIERMEAVPDSPDYFLFSRRSGDNKVFCFRAVQSGSVYQILTFPEELGSDTKTLIHAADLARPLQVMTSSEVGANNQAITGDYDLMTVCPRWGNYGSQSNRAIAAPELVFPGKQEVRPALIYETGIGLDRLLEMRTNTGARPRKSITDETYQGIRMENVGQLEEHHDLGNITPRVLRSMNALNKAMGAVGEKAALRRVNHGAESHRNHIFGALTRSDLKSGLGLPIIAFQPSSALHANSPTQQYGDVCTLTTLSEFEAYISRLHEAAFYVPKNWTWGMSIRDRYQHQD